MTTCPTCGAPVRVVSGDEGTSHYEPEDALALLAEARDYVSATAPRVATRDLLLRIDATLRHAGA